MKKIIVVAMMLVSLFMLSSCAELLGLLLGEQEEVAVQVYDPFDGKSYRLDYKTASEGLTYFRIYTFNRDGSYAKKTGYIDKGSDIVTDTQKGSYTVEDGGILKLVPQGYASEKLQYSFSSDYLTMTIGSALSADDYARM